MLIEKSIEVVTSSRKNSDHNGKIENYDFVEGLIKKLNPDFIFHFAANSTVSHDANFDNHNSISTGTLNILETVYRNNINCKVFISGSAMQFENNGHPISELTPFEASSPYSVSRIHSVYLSRYYRDVLKLKVYIGYFFNHDSPNRHDRHFNKKITNMIFNIKNGDSTILDLGDLSIQKEFNYAGDIVEAIWILINQNRVFEAVIGSGNLNTLREWVEYCFKKSNLNWQSYIKETQEFKNDYKKLSCDPTLIKSLGWTPKYDMEKLADLMLDLV
jgi:GDPmannose 4,6-dehydratase